MKKTSPDSAPLPAKPARRKYDEELKLQALSMICHGQPARSVAQALGITENLFHQWKRSASDIRSLEQTLERNLSWHRTRIKFIAAFVLALVTVKNVNLVESACAFAGKAK